MTGRADPAETLAYVDDCLDPEARSDFEARLKAEPELRREVARWESQNRAIRAAFGAPPRGALDLGGASNENGARRAGEAARPADDASRPFGQARQRRAAARPIAKPRPPGLDRPPVASPACRARGGDCLGRPAFARAAALRARCSRPARRRRGRSPTCRSNSSPAIRRRSPSASAPRLALPPPLAPGLRLVGARFAPGSQATATLYLYENSRGERVALMVEPLDEIAAAPPRRGEADGLSVAAWTGAGYGFVAAAAEDADVAALVAAAGADDDSWPTPALSAGSAPPAARNRARRLNVAALRPVGARLGVPGVDVEMRPGLRASRRSARGTAPP